MPLYVVLSRQMIDAGRSEAEGWNAEQLSKIGVSWSEVIKGWRNRTVGKVVSVENYEAFLRLRGKTTPPAE